MAPEDREDPRVGQWLHLGGHGGVQVGEAGPRGPEPSQAREHTAVHRRRIVSSLDGVLRQPRPVRPPVVGLVPVLGAQSGSFGMPSSSPLQTTGMPPQPYDDRVREEQPAMASAGVRSSPRASVAVEPGQARRRAADPPVAGGRVLLEHEPARRRPGEARRSTSRTGTGGARTRSSPTAAASSSSMAQPMSSWQRT